VDVSSGLVALLLGLIVLDVLLFGVLLGGSLDDSNESWITNENVETTAGVLFILVFVAFWMLVGVRIERWRRRRQEFR
jgi:hypothetical protein